MMRRTVFVPPPRHPWPTIFGDTGNTAATTALIAPSGAVRWSRAIDEAPHTLLVASSGQIIQVSQHLLSVRDAHGRLCWSVPGTYPAPALLLDDARLLIVEPERLVIYQLATGIIDRSIPLADVGVLGRYDAAHVLARTWTRDTGHQLHRVALDGTIVWTRPLAQWHVAPPLVFDDTIVLDDATILALDGDGHAAWLVEQPADTTWVVTLTKISPTQALAGIHTSDHAEVLRVDLLTRSTTLLPVPFAYEALHAVTRTPSGAVAVAATRYPREDTDGIFWPGVVVVDLAGTVQWQIDLKDDPIALAGDAVGNLVVVSGPTQATWDKYAVPYALHTRCIVASYDALGRARWTWHAPAPLAPTMGIGGDGTVYVVSAGQLWALGACAES